MKWLTVLCIFLAKYWWVFAVLATIGGVLRWFFANLTVA